MPTQLTKQAKELTDFALTKKKPSGTPCPICIAPEAEAINQAKRAARPGQLGGEMVRRWLIANCGYTEKGAPSKHAIQRHFDRGHHRRA